jgi:phospholipid/cholesterol/gamma-HCH transport system substrate-binding protein
MTTSPENKARWLFAAALAAVAAAVVVWLIASAARYTTYEIRSRDAVSGLVRGAPVEFHGVEVGKVQSVELMQPKLVRVLIEVRRDVPISSATLATIMGRGLAARGFTGYVFVNLEDTGGAGRPLTPARDSPYPLLASAPAQVVSMDTTIEQMNQTVQNVGALLQTVFDRKTVAALKDSLAGLEQVTQTLSANNQKLGAIIANAEKASAQMQPLLQSSNEAVKTLQDDVLPRTRETLVRLDNLSTSVNERMSVILRNTEQASTRFEPLLQSSNDAVLSLQTQILPEAQRTLTRLDQLSTTLGETTTRIRRNPSLLLRGGNTMPPGPGEAQ